VVKVDVSKTKETNFQASITNTIALVKALLEDFGVAVELLEKAKNYKNTEEAFPSGHSILFNETFEFERGFLEKEFNAVQKECLKSLETLCVFGYQEFYKNFLLILVEMHYPKHIMGMFGVSTKQLVAHMLQRREFKQTKFSQAYRMDYNSNHFIVGNSVTRPVQFSFGALPSGAAFTKKQGHGWNPTNVPEYFQVSSSDEDTGKNEKSRR